MNTLISDSQKANEIFVTLTYFNQEIIKQLENLKLDGKDITLVCKKPMKENGLVNEKAQNYIEQLNHLIIKCILVQTTPQPFVVIDEGLIWYGDLHFYTINDANKTSIRIVNSELANKLLQQYI